MRHILAALTLFLLTAAPASAGADAAAPGTFPGGVADPAGKTAYLQGAKGGIDALDLKTGKVLWSTDAFALPLALTGNRLLVQVPEKGKGNAVRVAVLDTADGGKELKVSEPITFPDWVVVGTTHGHSFTSHALQADANKLLLRWEARAWYAGGARPTPEIEQRARKNADGVAEVDLKTGAVKMLEAKGGPPAEALPKELDNVKSQQYWTGSSWETRPLIVGSKVAALSVGKVGDADKLVLQTWDKKTGKADAAVDLLQGKSLWTQLSIDRRYLFVHQALVKEQLPAGDYAWWVFSLEDGKQVAKVPFEPGSTGLAFLHGHIYTVTEVTRGSPKGMQRTRVLKALDAANGQTAWEHALYAPPPLLPLP